MNTFLVIGGLILILVGGLQLSERRKIAADQTPAGSKPTLVSIPLSMLAGIGSIVASFFLGTSNTEWISYGPSKPLQVQSNTTDNITYKPPLNPLASLTSRIEAATRLVESDTLLSPSDKKLMKTAVERIMTDEPRCIEVTAAAKSSTRPRYFINCTGSDQTSFNKFFTKKDLKEGSSLAMPSPVDRIEAFKICREAIKLKLDHPSTFSQGWLPPEFQVISDGRTKVQFSFKAPSAFGVEIRATARCVIDPTGKATVVSFKEE